MASPGCWVTCLSVFGSILVLLGSIFLGCFPVIYDDILEKVLIVSEDSPSYEAWITPPVPIYMQFFFFNVTNPDEIRLHGAKPNLTTVGPYTYLEVRTKINITWNETDGTVEYLNNKQYFFDESLSKGHKESDKITTINAVMTTLAFIASSNDVVGTYLWPELERGFDLFETHEAAELLMDGFELPEFDFDFSDLAPILPILNETEGLTGTIYEILDKLGLNPPEFLEMNKLVYFQNDTTDKTYRVKTGDLGMDDFQQITAWDGKPKLSYWPNIVENKPEELDPYCNMINGTDGSMYGPGVTADTILYIYDSMLCRSMYLTYEKNVDFHGLETLRFVPPQEMLENPEINHDNLCYCYPDRDSCLKAGFLNMEPCAAGAPVIMSTPHFYQGDDEELDKLIGLNPIKEEHETVLDVEPKTGVTLRAAKRIQLNVPLRQYGNLPSFKNVPEVIFPILYVNESVELSKEDVDELKKGVVLPFTIVDAVCGVLIALGGVLLLLAIMKHFRNKKVPVKNIKENGNINGHHYSASPDRKHFSLQKNNCSIDKQSYKKIPMNDN